MVDVLVLVAGIAAAFWKHLGQQSQQKDPHQDAHVGNQYCRVAHMLLPVLQPEKGTIKFLDIPLVLGSDLMSGARNLITDH